MSLCIKKACRSTTGNHPGLPVVFKASFPLCFLSLSLSIFRREWRLRTMSTSTWRWRGRMALWCSLKSSGTLHSANWWKPTVNGRWGRHKTLFCGHFLGSISEFYTHPKKCFKTWKKKKTWCVLQLQTKSTSYTCCCWDSRERPAQRRTKTDHLKCKNVAYMMLG